MFPGDSRVACTIQHVSRSCGICTLAYFDWIEHNISDVYLVHEIARRHSPCWFCFKLRFLVRTKLKLVEWRVPEQQPVLLSGYNVWVIVYFEYTSAAACVSMWCLFTVRMCTVSVCGGAACIVHVGREPNHVRVTRLDVSPM